MTVTTLPHPPHRLPLLGDLLTSDPRSPTQNLMAHARRLGPVFETKIFNQDLVVVSGPQEYAELGDEKRFRKHVGFAFAVMREMLGDALATAYTDEPNWSKAHNILAPAFSLAAMKDYHDTVLDTARELVAYWDGTAEQGPVDVHADTSKLTLETIARIGFGYRFRPFAADDPDAYAAAVSRMFEFAGRSTYRIPVHWLDNLVRHRVIKRNDADLAYVRGVVDDVIAARRLDPDPPSGDLLALMLSAVDPETGERLGDENIRNQVITFLDAGHETTSGTLSFALHLLATHPEVADRARAEIHGLWPQGTDPDPVFADIHRLKYVRHVIDETLRLWPIAAGYFREPVADTTIGGHPVAEGQPMLALTLQVHRDPVWGGDSESFDPDRFLPERARTRPVGIYKPFGTGVRACIGRQLALHESVLVLALILHRYELEPEPGYELEVAEGFTLKPAGLRLGLRRR
ncbi:cytochrome P450 [Rhodococcus sp. NPDC059234]|uniref:cytochrome P450 n=1 Tax=Rhodococcus sp. NPDC059234 TaxID=3346781 RepID=UPI00366B94A7